MGTLATLPSDAEAANPEGRVGNAEVRSADENQAGDTVPMEVTATAPVAEVDSAINSVAGKGLVGEDTAVVARISGLGQDQEEGELSGDDAGEAETSVSLERIHGGASDANRGSDKHAARAEDSGRGSEGAEGARDGSAGALGSERGESRRNSHRQSNRGERAERGKGKRRQPDRDPPGRGADSADWHRGKREWDHSEEDYRSSSAGGDDERGRKRRKSENAPLGSLALSPEESKFRMGMQGGSDRARGSPRGVRDRRKGRYQPPRAVNEEDQRATLYVGDLDPSTSKRDLQDAFQRFGEIKESKMVKGQCYGFVTFRSRSDAEIALQSENSIDVLGRKPYLSWAQGAMPAWKIGVGGFVINPSEGIVDKRDALTRAAEVAAATAAAVLAKKELEEQNKGNAPRAGRSLVAYDDLF